MENIQQLSIYKTIVFLSAILMISMIITLKYLIDVNHLKDARIEQLENENRSLNDNLLNPR